VPTAGQGIRLARTFWWDRARPVDADVSPLRAVIFDMDGAMADIERDAHRAAFNAAFAAFGLPIAWDVETYRRLLSIRDERQRIASDLHRRGFGKASEPLATHLLAAKRAVFANCVLDGDVTGRHGLIDVVMSLFVAGVWVAVVTPQPRAWVEPLVRQLIGDGLVETIVTGDDVTDTSAEPDVHGLALWEMGIGPESALAIEGSAAGLRAAARAGLATIVVPTEYTAGQDFTGAVQVRSSYEGADPLLAASCERLHRRWWSAAARARAAA
jgi:beta-phosphoglucomutase-like phosphatase (HAD superfamily)